MVTFENNILTNVRENIISSEKNKAVSYNSLTTNFSSSPIEMGIVETSLKKSYIFHFSEWYRLHLYHHNFVTALYSLYHTKLEATTTNLRKYIVEFTDIMNDILRRKNISYNTRYNYSRDIRKILQKCLSKNVKGSENINTFKLKIKF